MFYLIDTSGIFQSIFPLFKSELGSKGVTFSRLGRLGVHQDRPALVLSFCVGMCRIKREI